MRCVVVNGRWSVARGRTDERRQCGHRFRYGAVFVVQKVNSRKIKRREIGQDALEIGCDVR